MPSRDLFYVHVFANTTEDVEKYMKSRKYILYPIRLVRNQILFRNSFSYLKGNNKFIGTVRSIDEYCQIVANVPATKSLIDEDVFDISSGYEPPYSEQRQS